MLVCHFIGFLEALQQNHIMDVFVDDWRTLGEDVGGKVDTHLKEYQSFTDLNYSKDKTISHINWHPSINGETPHPTPSLRERGRERSKSLK